MLPRRLRILLEPVIELDQLRFDLLDARQAERLARGVFKQCCYYNYDHVDGWECRRKRTERARARCWREATEKMGRCNAQCERDRGVITTIIGTPP